ncbi:MAG TPA: HAMP domain-containing sensor histidine kinase [Kineosporiaceae bacterium]|nr:HAMP domain-containing sensor histidine kinase [Kineosporiaceae bacterium]
MFSVPLRVRLVGVVVLLSALALTLSGLAASTALRGYLLDRVDTQLASSATRVATDERLHGNDDNDRRPDPLTDTFSEVVREGKAPQIQLATGLSAPALPTDLSSQPTAFTVPSVDGRHTWRVQVSVQDDFTVVVAFPLDGVDATMARLMIYEIGGGAVVLLLLAGVASVVVRRALRPLAQVEQAAEQIAAGDLSQRVPEGHPRTEVGSLSMSFNSMVAQIETAFTARSQSEAEARASEQRMRRFVADASHELRTPLTSIRGFAELYRQGALPAGADVDRAMSRVESEACRMGELVDDLLLLARLDQQRPLDRAPVDLLAVVGNVVHDLQAAAPNRIIRLETSGIDCSVEGDASRLAQVFANLATNALIHTPAATTVTLRVTTEAGQAVIDVADNGPGIAEADREQIFERFYRADSSRTRASGGSGLGLSIVAGLVHAHGGTVQATETPGGGATFRVCLPLLVRPISQGRSRPTSTLDLRAG